MRGSRAAGRGSRRSFCAWRASRSIASNSRETLLRVVPMVSSSVSVLWVFFSIWMLKRSISSSRSSSAPQPEAEMSIVSLVGSSRMPSLRTSSASSSSRPSTRNTPVASIFSRSSAAKPSERSSRP